MANIISKRVGYTNDNAFENVVNYIVDSPHLDLEKTIMGNVYIDPYRLGLVYKTVETNAYVKEGNRKCHHFIIGFDDSEIKCEMQLLDILRTAVGYFSQKYILYGGIHTGTKDFYKQYNHIHIAVGSVSYTDGKCFYGRIDDYNKFTDYMRSTYPDMQWTHIPKFN